MVSRARHGVPLALVAGVFAVLPSTAAASYVQVTETDHPQLGRIPVLLVSGAFASSELNQPNGIVIEDAVGENTFIVTDTKSPLVAAGPRCHQFGSNKASCNGFNFGTIRYYGVGVFGGNDDVNVRSSDMTLGGVVSLGAGNDRYVAAPTSTAPDDIRGGDGVDTVDYIARSSTLGGVIVRPGGFVFDDGRNGTEDRIGPDVERVFGTNVADSITAPSPSAPAGLFGHNGNDTLVGSSFGDTLDGQGNADVLRGLGGTDTLTGREEADEVALRDRLECGVDLDTAIMDLMDTSLGCENRQIAAIDEGGILSIRNKPLRRNRDGDVKVRLHCPEDSKTRCDGELTLKRRGRRVGSADYRIRRGDGKTIAVAVPERIAGEVVVRAVEPDSQGRPKTTVALLKLR